MRDTADHESPARSIPAEEAPPYRRPPARLRHRLADAVFASPLYRLLLGRAAPRSLAFVPSDAWPGDDQRGLALVTGHWRFAGLTIEQETPPWDADEAGEDYLAELHGFAWLRDLKALGGDAGRRAARAAVDDWIGRNGRWDVLSWRPDVMGGRISAWLSGHDFFCLSAETGFRRRVLQSLQRQATHLARVVERAPEGAARIEAIKGLILSAFALRLPQGSLQRAVRLLDETLDREVLADGGQAERNPSSHLAMLRHLVDIRAALRQARVVAPTRLQTTIDRMAPALRFYRHGDGALALFNGAFEEGAHAVEHALTLADAPGRPLKWARDTGYQRVTAGRTLLLVDTGRTAPDGFDRNAHAGPLAFEMSVGRDRVIVNCGHWASRDGGEETEWYGALAATAAHSTLTVAATNAFSIGPRGGLRRRPTRVAVDRKDTLRGSLIDALHDGYRERYGLTHRRRIFIESDGSRLRGEDVLMADSDKSRGMEFAIRFHLHPAVTVEPNAAGDAAILTVGAQGDRWTFRGFSAGLAIEDSVYVPRPGERLRTKQIVLADRVATDGAIVGWLLQRAATEQAAPGVETGQAVEP